MANKKVSQLTSKPSVLVTDLFPIADPSTGQLYKTTISDLGTAIGSGVSSVNGLVGAVVLDTDDIQELVSPTNKWFTDTRARAALSASSPLAYNSGTGVFSIPAATSSQNGYLTSTDWTTFNSKQSALSGTGFVKISGTTISYDNTSYLPLTGGTLTGTLIGTRAEFTTSTLVDGILVNNGSGRGIRIINAGAGYGLIINNETASSAIPFVIQKSGLDKIYFTDSGAGNFTSSLTAFSFVKSGGTSSQYLMADGSVSTLTNPVTGTGTSGIVAKFNGTSTITDSIIYDNGTRVSIGADVTTSNKFTAVASTTSSYAVVAQASGAANGFWATLSGTGEIFRGQTSGGSYFIINNGGNAFLNGNLNVGDFASTSYRLNVVGTGNFTGALSGTSASFTGNVSITANSARLTVSESGGAEIRVTAGGSTGYIGTYSNHSLIFLTNSATALTIATSGAATFSSSVTAGSWIITSNNLFTGGNNTGVFLTGSTSDFSWGLNRETAGLTLYAGSASSPKMTITTGGLVGIGTTAPNAPLHLYKSSGSVVMTLQTGTAYGYFYNDGTNIGLASDQGATGNKFIVNRSAPDSSMVITSAGNVGIGTTAPDRDPSGTRSLAISGGGSLAASLDLYGNARNFAIFTGGAGALGFFDLTAGSERMRITSGGDLLVGSTTDVGQRMRLEWVDGGTGKWGIKMNMTGGGSANLIEFLTGGSVRGSITTNGTTTAYNITSDYRLKEDLQPINGLEIVNKIKVYDYKWKASDSRMDGVLAHELAEVLPYAVTGVKDGEQMQQVDYSKIVPVMVQAIKELKAELDTLKNK